MNDTEYFAQALAEYRQANEDLREFADLPTDIQQEILRRAQRLKPIKEQQKRG